MSSEIGFNLTAFLLGYIMTTVAYVYFYANVPILLKRHYSANAQCKPYLESSYRRVKTASKQVTYLICVESDTA